VLLLKYPQFAQSLNFFDEDIFVYFWYWDSSAMIW